MNFKNHLLTIALLAISISSVKAQDKIFGKNENNIKTFLNNEEAGKVTLENKPSANGRAIDKVSLGVGLGLDYGGIGANITAYPVKYVGLFVGLGSNLVGLGYNVGAKFRYTSDTAKISPYATVMYGYNAVVMVLDASQYNKTFYGVSYGLGMDFRFSSRSNNYMSLGLTLPQRDPKYQAYMDDLESNHGIVFESKPSSVGISIGYRFMLK